MSSVKKTFFIIIYLYLQIEKIEEIRERLLKIRECALKYLVEFFEIAGQSSHFAASLICETRWTMSDWRFCPDLLMDMINTFVLPLLIWPSTRAIIY